MSEGNADGRQKVRLYWNHICILHNFEKQTWPGSPGGWPSAASTSR